MCVFDPNVGEHHHCIDDSTGKIFDRPWKALRVTGQDALKGFEVKDLQVVLRGRRKKGKQGLAGIGGAMRLR